MLRGDEARESAILMTAAWADRSLGGGRGPRRPHNHTSCPRRSYLREPSASHRRSHLPTWVGDVGLREWRVGAVDRPPRGSVHRSSLQVACDRTNPGGNVDGGLQQRSRALGVASPPTPFAVLLLASHGHLASPARASRRPGTAARTQRYLRLGRLAGARVACRDAYRRQ